MGMGTVYFWGSKLQTSGGRNGEEWRNGGQGLGNIGARLEGLLKQIGNWRSNGELGEHWGTGEAMENTGIAF